MTAAVASKGHAPLLGKMKRPSHIQTSTGASRPTNNPSPSPSSATKRLPGSSANAPLTNGLARPNRRPQRAQTRNTDGPPGTERRTTLKDPEPYVANEAHILKKYKGNPPSLIVHLHPMHFRFDQQDGSFSYQSEMRVFIEHLQKKTIPHDMLEEFRKSGVKFYDGWLIVKVVDHKSVAKAAAITGAEAEDDKPFSIHNYNTFITPSAYVPYPKQQSTNKSPVMKQESGVALDKQTNGDHASSSTLGEPGSDDSARPSTKPGKPQPRIFHVALRPTNLSKHMDLVLASMELDPKSALNRKQSQVFNARTPGSANTMPAPLSLDTATAGDKGPASKKRRLRIAPDQMIHFERSLINHTAPPLCLDLVDSLEEAEVQMLSLRDPLYDQEPPSPKSRKRTVAELAADDALAKEQERFMLIMAERDGGGAGTNAGVVDGQAAGALFQPDFGKFNTIQQIKFQAAEKQKREEERKVHDDANKRIQEEERKRHQEVMRLQQHAERNQQARLQEQKRVAMQAAAAQQQQQQQLQLQQQLQAQQQQQAQQNAQQMAQLSGVPPNMQSQMRQGQPMSSPVMPQSTPHGNSSPIVNGQAQAVPMATQGSQQGMAGSPARPGSAMQHGHPGAAMARGPSNQGPSRNGTPQIPHNTPAMRQTTPVMRQGTPAQRMSQASPHPGMMVPTPQMQQAQMMAPGQQMPNGMNYPQNAQQLAMQQQRHHAMQQAAMQQGMLAGNPVMAQTQMAHMQAQRHAETDRQTALLQQQQQRQRQQALAAAHQAQMQQAQQQQMGTPQPTAPSPANSAQHAQNQYSQNLRNQLQNQMQQVANHGSPAPSQGQPTQQQQIAQLQRQQAAQAGQMNSQMGQQGMQMTPQQQQMMRNAQVQQMQQQAQFGQMNPQQQQQQMQQQMQQMMMQQQQQRQGGQLNPQQMAAMQQQRQAYPPPIQANMAKIRDQRMAHHTNKLAMEKYSGNMQAISPQEHETIKRLAMQDAQTWARKWQQTNQRAMMQQAQQAGMVPGGQMPQ